MTSTVEPFLSEPTGSATVYPIRARTRAKIVRTGLGTGYEFYLEDPDGREKLVGSISAEYTALNPEESKLVFRTLNDEGMDSRIEIGPDGGLTLKGTLNLKTVTITSTSYTAGNETVVLVDDTTAGGIVTVTLPSANKADQRVYHIKKVGNSYNVVIDGNGSELIDGKTTQTIGSQYTSVQLVVNGS